jgi:hypothetical protein
MLTILATVFVFHFEYFCLTGRTVTEARFFHSLASKKPPATGAPTPAYLSHNKISECKDCDDDECPYFHQTLPTPPLAFAGPTTVGGCF